MCCHVTEGLLGRPRPSDGSDLLIQVVSTCEGSAGVELMGLRHQHCFCRR